MRIKPTKEIKEVVKKCFPEYRGRKYRMENYIPKELNSYWDGGTKDSYCFYHLGTKEVVLVGTNHPCFELDKPNQVDPTTFPPDVIIVKHTIFCGKDIGITIYFKTLEQMQLNQDTTLKLT